MVSQDILKSPKAPTLLASQHSISSTHADIDGHKTNPLSNKVRLIDLICLYNPSAYLSPTKASNLSFYQAAVTKCDYTESQT